MIALSPKDSKYGAVETSKKPKMRASYFKRHRDDIDGIIVTLPNFGDERAIAETLRLADLNVPVLIQATPDTPVADDHPRPPRQLLRQDVAPATT